MNKQILVAFTEKEYNAVYEALKDYSMVVALPEKDRKLLLSAIKKMKATK